MINIEVFDAACVLIGVEPPIWRSERGWWELHWTVENWLAFVTVNKAYGIFITEYAEARDAPPTVAGWLPVPANAFTQRSN